MSIDLTPVYVYCSWLPSFCVGEKENSTLSSAVFICVPRAYKPNSVPLKHFVHKNVRAINQ